MLKLRHPYNINKIILQIKSDKNYCVLKAISVNFKNCIDIRIIK